MVAIDRGAVGSPLLLRVEEAAELLGIARTSMFHLLASCQIESVRVGRLRRIPIACLEEYIERLRGEERELSQVPPREPPSGDG